ncbi:MAG TPA: paraquat-inducible protein A [Candidatus Limnocylindrales bacterium]|nr:paraquat-inducible protein A [Candidatus Limnocylindrales bacterium]
MSASAVLIACHDCDLLQHRVPLPANASARCPRCGSILYRDLPDSMERTLAFSLASLALLAVANLFPFMTFQMSALVQVNHLASGVIELFDQGYWELALLVGFSIVVAPALRLALLVFVAGSLRFGRRPRGLVPALKLAGRLREWAMLDVFLLGAIVAIIKLSDLADVHLGIGMYAYCALILTLSAANSLFDRHAAWDELDRRP